ncbi:MAG: YlbF family regulator [Coprobacillus sp.]|nr:YlbF family regulator [Coprobacillus sp.]
MSDFDKDLENLKEYLYNTPTFKEYFRLKEQVENDTELQKLKEEVANAKVKNSANYEELKEKYENNPLNANFTALREEIDNTLLEIKEILEG